MRKDEKARKKMKQVRKGKREK